MISNFPAEALSSRTARPTPMLSITTASPTPRDRVTPDSESVASLFLSTNTADAAPRLVWAH